MADELPADETAATTDTVALPAPEHPATETALEAAAATEDGLSGPDTTVLRVSEQVLRDRLVGTSSAADGCFGCYICDVRFRTVVAVKRHERNNHKQSYKGTAREGQHRTCTKSGMPACCPQCGEVFQTMQLMERHYCRRHIEGTVFACSKCGRQHATKVDCAEHEKYCRKGSAEGTVFQCLTCQMMLSTHYKWKQHRQITQHFEFALVRPGGASAPELVDAPRHGDDSGSMPSDNPGIQLEDLDPDSIGDVLDDDDPAALDAEQRYGALSPLADTSLDAHVTDVRPLLRKRGRASL